MVLIPNYGLFAVPLSFFIGTLTTYVALWIFTEKIYPLKFSIKNTFIHFSMSLGAIYLESFIHENIYLKTMIFIVFTLILIFTTKEFLDILKNRWFNS